MMTSLFRRLRPLAAVLFVAAGAAHADDTPPKCLYVDVADVPIHYMGAGLKPAVDGVINGMPASMLVDTGAFETQLTLNGAARRDLSLSMTGRYTDGIAGSARLYTARVKDISIGPAHSTHGSTLFVLGQDSFEFDAIAGAPFLLQTDLEIDLRAKQMRFFRTRDCGDRALLLWKEPTVVVPFQRNYDDRSPNPHFKVTVDGQELDAIIDTGSHHTLMTLDAAKRVGIDVDAPNVKSWGQMFGVGTDRTAQWGALIKTFQIGDETIKNAEIGVIDAQSRMSTDVLIGQDFLRAHRVLFAMSQRKMYFAYLGGDAFTRSEGVPDWVRAEAEGGSADAQYALALAYSNGRGVARDPKLSLAWLEKAAAGGQPHARLSVARREMLKGQVDSAIPKLRAAIDALPADHVGPLWLYIARVRNGQADLARTELQASLKKRDDEAWPDPIAEFYLGKLDAAKLLDVAEQDKPDAHARTCMANEYMSEWYSAQGNQAQADTLLATVRAHCRAPVAVKPAAAPATAPAPAAAPAPAQGAAP